jgi:hypothetical protein
MEAVGESGLAEYWSVNQLLVRVDGEGFAVEESCANPMGSDPMITGEGTILFGENMFVPSGWKETEK